MKELKEVIADAIRLHSYYVSEQCIDHIAEEVDQWFADAFDIGCE